MRRAAPGRNRLLLRSGQSREPTIKAWLLAQGAIPIQSAEANDSPGRAADRSRSAGIAAAKWEWAQGVLRRATPIQYAGPATSGRTKPSFITCETDDGAIVEIVAKFSGGCDEGNVNLTREVIGACLAGDLSLPVPEPFLVEVLPQWVATIPDADARGKVQKSSSVAFGSRHLTGQLGTWTPGNVISDIMLPTAAHIFVFDAIIQNPDRRLDNPNCLVRGDEIRIFDHELAFSHGLVLGWNPPWAVGGLKSMETNGNHIFRSGLKGRIIDYAPIRAAWTSLSDAQIADYELALPVEWADGTEAAASATKLIREGRDNIDAVLEEVKRVLS